MNDHAHRESGKYGLLQRAVVTGFSAAVAVWITWFITHLPWVGLSEKTSMPLLLGAWTGATLPHLFWAGKRTSILAGMLSGLICAAVSLMILGSKIAPDPAAAVGTPGSAPSVMLVVPAFLLLGATIGMLSGIFAGVVSQGIHPDRSADESHLARFAAVTAFAITPLLVVGGLVTSTSSGMAFPDWPTSAGLNMLLYPLGPRSEPGKFLEHSHRLFGMLVGLISLVLLVWVLLAEKRRWVKVLTGIAFVFVCAQGGLGGLRVLLGSDDPALDKPVWAMLHGVLAQLVFGVMVALAAALTPTFRFEGGSASRKEVRRFKVFSTALTHALILQLLLGAAYRHMRQSHALFTHMAFSLVVVVLALLAGFLAIKLSRSEGLGQPGSDRVGVRRTLSRLGLALIAVVSLQFVLGWLAFLVGGEARTASSPAEALVRTAHQANGAMMIALATLAFVWSRWLLRRASDSPDSGTIGAGAAAAAR